MFVEFFYTLKEVGIPVSPTSFLTFHKAILGGLVSSVDDLYTNVILRNCDWAPMRASCW